MHLVADILGHVSALQSPSAPSTTAKTRPRRPKSPLDAALSPKKIRELSDGSFSTGEGFRRDLGQLKAATALFVAVTMVELSTHVVVYLAQIR
jgi:hypothetical protein